ncbi:MAG: hypothetical protein IPH28_15720 [Cytophagaceae bacterium]|nr:hypothetical protein [Cytophagaceae bacterium]
MEILFLLNFLIWVLYLSATYLILNAFITTNQITIIVSLAVLIMASTGWAGPTQAAIGTFHFLVSQTLILYGFSANISLALAVSLHLVFTIFDIIWGIIAIVILNSKLFNLPLKNFCLNQLLNIFFQLINLNKILVSFIYFHFNITHEDPTIFSILLRFHLGENVKRVLLEKTTKLHNAKF